jgi:Fe2+ transport system protein FeoA
VVAVTCSFCGGSFEEAAARRHCQACPVGPGCRSVRCPRCGYETPEEPRFLRRLARWAGSLSRRSAGEERVQPRTLADLGPGESGTVEAIRMDGVDMRKLLALGVVPGCPITLLRRSPSFVFRMGYSQFTVDRRLADSVLVRSPGA